MTQLSLSFNSQPGVFESSLYTKEKDHSEYSTWTIFILFLFVWVIFKACNLQKSDQVLYIIQNFSLCDPQAN